MNNTLQEKIAEFEKRISDLNESLRTDFELRYSFDSNGKIINIFLIENFDKIVIITHMSQENLSIGTNCREVSSQLLKLCIDLKEEFGITIK